MTRVCALAQVCEEDAAWIPQYLAEIDRLQTPFAVHLDRCSQATKDAMTSHPLCVGSTANDDPAREYTEMDKQGPMDLLRLRGEYDWLLHWDIDEVWERGAPAKLAALSELGDRYDYAQVTWVNLWGDDQHIRVDSPFNRPPRVKLYNMQRGRHWWFDHKITNGCKMLDLSQVRAGWRLRDCVMNGFGECYRTDLVCVHHGNKTRALREQHKARWDRIYTTAVGNNPLGFWKMMLDEETYPPTVARHDYL